MPNDDQRISRRSLLRLQLARRLDSPAPPLRAPASIVEALVELAAVEAGMKVLDLGASGADPQDLPYADGAFDAVLCAFAATPAPSAARELVRVTCPGGVLALALVDDRVALDGLLEELETRTVEAEESGVRWLLVRGRRPIPQA